MELSFTFSWFSDMIADFNSKLFLLAGFTTDIMSVINGYGQHYNYLSPQQLTNFAKWNLVAEAVWLWDITLVKISVSFMFLRVIRALVWKRTLAVLIYASLFCVIITAIVTTALQYTACKPLRIIWDRNAHGTCRTPKQISDSIIATSVIFAVTDFKFALFPLTFIFSLKRPFREIVAIFGLMGLGLIASGVGLIKFIRFREIFKGPDETWVSVPMTMGSFVESNLGLIAACIPPLKARGQKFFQSIGTRELSVSGKHLQGGIDTELSTAYKSSIQSKTEI
jgi:hypothetical protein